MDVPGDVRRADRAQRGRIWRLGGGCGDPAGLADGGLVQQPDSEPGVAGAVVAFGLGEHGSGLGRGVGVRVNPASPARVAKIAASCPAV
jgi:hypothetical protein